MSSKGPWSAAVPQGHQQMAVIKCRGGLPELLGSWGRESLSAWLVGGLPGAACHLCLLGLSPTVPLSASLRLCAFALLQEGTPSRHSALCFFFGYCRCCQTPKHFKEGLHCSHAQGLFQTISTLENTMGSLISHSSIHIHAHRDTHKGIAACSRYVLY